VKPKLEGPHYEHLIEGQGYAVVGRAGVRALGTERAEGTRH
jgi:hypothetical protein